MPARIDVIDGPDRGWAFTVVGGEARIGRGAGNQVRLTDPAWPDGDVRIQLRQGGYLLTNGLPYAVYLDGTPLPPAAVRNLHHGATLQPTGGTLLRFRVVDAAPAGTPEGGVVSEPPAPPRARLAVRRIAPFVVLLAAAGYFGYTQFQTPPALDPVAAAGHKEAVAAVGRDPRLADRAPDARRAHLALTDAVYHESAAHRSAAHQRYRAARDGLAKVRRGLDPTDPAHGILADAEEFVTRRLNATAGR